MLRKGCVLLVLFLLLSPSARAAEAEDIIYSVLFPGWGQLRSGRYTRGTLLMGAEIVTLAGLMIVNIQYDRAVEGYDNAKLMYDNATYIGDAHYHYDMMLEKYDSAENYHKYRNMMLGAAAGVWVIGVADMIWGKDAADPPLTLEVRNNGFMISKSFSF
ncbi:MAG: hypothetical protein JXB45_11795 [Candidatus Krumholzibacteriota bacterium]|nr:hypothetical protein [Candidatus Krumholzibacteriota bacterium]